MIEETELVKIRELALIAIFSDDDFMNLLVLKGGNALEIGYGYNSRASIDLDFSVIEASLFEDPDISRKLEATLSNTFIENGYKVFDFKLIAKPKKRIEETAMFWAGYEVIFKIIEPDKFEAYKDNPTKLGAKAIALNHEKKNMSIDFGLYEYCGEINEKEIQGYTIRLYTPTLIVIEKLRAICQQMSDYLISIGKEPAFGGPRPRDFYDIYTIMKHSETKIDLASDENKEHLKKCFYAKRVSISLLNKISETREFHRQEEAKLKDAVRSNYQGFDFYFDYVVELLISSNLHSYFLEELAQ